MKQLPDVDVDNRLPWCWLSVDPGDFNVGVARWEHSRCVEAFHTCPDDMVDMLVPLVASGDLGLLVYERFQLYGHEAGRQQGSEFLTSQLVGAMRHICRRGKVPTEQYLASHHKKIYKAEWNSPPIKPIREWKSYGHGPHAKDAENLGLYHVYRLKMKGRGY